MSDEQKRATISVLAFLATIPLANWALRTWGFVSIGFGLVAPAGVYFAGLSFGLRDIAHELAGRRYVIGAILVGAGLSWWIEPDFAVASGVAFLVSESADLAVYDPLRNRSWPAAVVLSNTVGAAVDSVLFLWLAFSSTTGWVDLTIGKLYMVAPVMFIMREVRRRDLLRQPLNRAHHG
jgi:uncharacterized PurR-regulated membrane protein YhhQ (DUF165 family)